MSWTNVSKKQMGLGKGLACFSLLLLMLLQLQITTTTPCCAANKFSRFKSEAAAAAASSINGRFKGKELQDGDEIFGADKRKVNTGPNPLHNR